MKPKSADIYRAPGSLKTLSLVETVLQGDDVIGGALVTDDGTRFPIIDGLPDFSWPQALSEKEQATTDFYDGRVDVYDKYLPLTFSTFGEDETDTRNTMIDQLHLKPGMRVLEIGAGTGRDSEIIATRIGQSGEFHCQDLVRSMLERNRSRLQAANLKAEFSLAGASHLPFADDYFDAVYQFGGVGEFPDIAQFFREAVRVTKPGGRIVVGDESMPPWLRQTRFAKILATTNPQFNAPLPLEHLPIEARNVNLRWLIGGTFYLLDFTVGVGEPPANLDYDIPGPRGGTHTTRYLGQLEGVKPETKALAHKAREKLNISMHDWLDELVKREARRVLDEESDNG